MRVARDAAEFERMFNTARAEAEAAFSNPDVYIEKFVEEPRHIEIQVFGDMHGTVVHLGERECSIQRRHQKLLEESPSPIVTEALRTAMGAAAVKGSKSVGYVGAGTIEFLVDRNRDFYFMEMNTRIQVEHCVTEEVTGLDLVKEQLRVASGDRISKRQVKPIGHAIEMRINAEDVARDFRPTPGTIDVLHFPGGHGIRIDSHIYAGYRVPPHYDSLLAKLICTGATRDEAIAKSQAALEEFIIEGVPTTIPFHKKLLADSRFRAGDFDTRFLDRFSWLD
jgi:acetyl-CoA carboxylase biotin carboxylase subunit